MTEKLKITGTMLPILMMGEHYGRTPTTLYDEATGLAEREPVDTGDTRRGLEMEVRVINEVCKQHQYSVESLQAEPVILHVCHAKNGTKTTLSVGDAVVYEDFKWCATGHVDAIVVDAEGNRIVLEVKCPRSYKAKRIAEDGCPPEYVLQSSWYAMLADAHHAEVIVWDCDSWDFLTFTVPRSSHLEALMLTRATAFAEAVASGVRPGEVVSLAREVPVIGQTVADAQPEAAGILRALADCDLRVKIEQAKIAELRSQLMAMWPDGIKTLRCKDGSATMSAGRTATSFDYKKLLVDRPEIDSSLYLKKTVGQPFVTFRAKEEKI